jgi:hypothetical protein
MKDAKVPTNPHRVARSHRVRAIEVVNVARIPTSKQRLVAAERMSTMMTCEAIKTYAIARIVLNDDGTVANTPAAVSTGQEFVALVDAYVRTHAVPWAKAFEIVKASREGKDALRRYGQSGISAMNRPEVGSDLHSEHPALTDRPDVEIDRLAREHMSKTGEQNYSLAVRHVLKESHALRQAYANYTCSKR